MIDWRTTVAENILPSIINSELWIENLQKLLAQDSTSPGLHLAVFVEPYLSYILEGKKTIESRFGIRRFAPYGKVAPNDIILLKKSSGPIVGICKVSDVWFYNLNPLSWKQLREDFTKALCAQDPNFWKQRENAAFATLMRINQVTKINPVEYSKRDRRGWVVLQSNSGLSPQI